MDCGANSDLFFLTDEKFDFDVSLSPASSKGDEDEVFLGPVSHEERCVSVNVESLSGVRASWSPLSGDQLEAVCQEAHRLADQLQCSELSSQPHGEDAETAGTTADKDEFVQDAVAKLGVLHQTASALSPVKRQTFCVQDSPMRQLPPAVQNRLLRGSSSTTSTRPASTSTRPASTVSSTRPTSTSTSNRPASTSTRPAAGRSGSSPAAAVKPLPRTGLRGKAALGVAVVLPSRPAATTASCSAGKSRVEKPRMQPPSKPLGSWRRSPSCLLSSRAGSSEDLLSDSASVASDISDSSLNSSLQGKRTLAPPTKRALGNISGVRAPPTQKRRVMERKNTSSSSSSVSSFNSSLSLSPAAGKLNSSLSRSQSSSTGPAPSISRPANQSRPRRSTVYAAAEPASSAAGRRSLSTQARKLSEVEAVKATRSTPLKRAEATPLPVTPAKTVLERSASIPTAASARLQCGLKTKSKPEALVAPTPGGIVRGARQGDAPDASKPKRLTSMSGVDSLPQTPSAGSCTSLQAKTRRPSALPTPVRRRMSSIPVATPTRAPSTFDFRPAPASARRERSCSPAPADAQEAEPVDALEVQPFCLEEEEPVLPAAPPTSPSQPDQSESADPGAPGQGESEPIKHLIELQTTEKSKTMEVLLLDLPAPTLHIQEKLLIDLTNTPDLIRTSSKTCTSTQQLIDLSSPLIKWSPEEKRENNAPLINLSF
ncbi:hypothetical protein VZT92_024164 [Zoarces viviparus]|uniref:G2 and S phase-expressed protein 1 N-terminal domain-containing protein n=1 Tax=Zoarces viviparus TaxID=48416 RepID=A0AAW1E169_ZOAVI